MKFSKGLMVFLAFGVAAYAVVTYLFTPLGSVVDPAMKQAFEGHPVGIYTHIFAAALALALGPLQFSTRLRQRRPMLHRWLGRIYLGIGVLFGGTAGLYVAQFAYGGVVGQLGFGVLAALWLYTGARAYLAIRSGAIAVHRTWMVRNFALTFAAVTLRLYLGLSGVAGIEFSVAYPIIAWLCWVPNLAVAEWRFNPRLRPSAV